MRPLKLEIKGLRSYRTHTVIDFPDTGGLIGFIGDTGSGKSSILEAMTYALFNAWSWSGGSTKDLISSDMKTMTVAFTFVADGRIWKVTRATSRDNYPPPIHELQLVDGVDRYSGEADVNAQITHLLGLKRDTFLSSVILPQGRFETLLVAGPKDRTAILMGILRLDQLARAGTLARDIADRLRSLVQRADLQRATRFLPNPSAAAEEAAQRLAAASGRLGALRRAEAKHDKLAATVREGRDRARALRAAAQPVWEKLGEHSKLLRDLLPAHERLAIQRRDALKELEEAEKAAAAARKELEGARVAAEDLVELGRAQGILERLLVEIPELEEKRQEITTRDSALAQERASVADHEVRSAVLAEEVSTAKASLAAAQARLDAATQRSLEASKSLLPQARRSATAHREVSRNLEQARERLPVLTADVAGAEAAAGAASCVLEAREAELLSARRCDHAASAAIGLHAGDGCPICSRPLPDGFAPPPASTDVAEAEAAVRVAREAVKAADASLSAAETALQVHMGTVEGLTRQETETTATAAEDLRRLRDTVPDAELARADEEILAPLTLAGEAARLEKEAADGSVTEASQALAAHEVLLAPRRKAIEEEERAIGRLRSQLEGRTATMARDRASIPLAYRPAEDAGPSTITPLIERVRRRIAELKAIDEARKEAEAKARGAQEVLKETDRQQRDEVDRPAQRVWGDVTLLADRTRSAQRAARHDPFDDLSSDEDLAFRAEAAALVEEAARQVAVALDELATAAEASANESETAAAGVLAGVGLDGAQNLRAEVERTAGDVTRWADDERRAREQIEPLREIEAVIAPARAREEALRELSQHLSEAKFLQHVCARRQEALLKVASEVLLTMTNDRFGFAADFRIGDRLLGRERSPRTLSGGETFLASLSLALGLVELAGRSGGRLEALFLDEGFGSLDQQALDEAVTALEKVATGGRMVTVVTHLRRVMEEIDRILLVTRQPEGSVAQWLTREQREELVEADAAAGIVD